VEDKVIDHLAGLPTWMQFTILLSFTLTLIITAVLKIRMDNKVSNKLINNEQKLSTLLDLLYAKFANNLSLDVAKEIINLCYLGTRYKIKDKIIELLRNHNYLNEGKFNKYQFKYDLIEYVNNVYYEDSMFLGKLSCKSVKLNFYHTEKFKPEFIIDSISTFLETTNFKLVCTNTSPGCNNIDTYLGTLFQTIINKTLIQLEDTISRINQDYGN